MSCYQHMNGTLVLYTFSLAANCHTAVHTAGRSGVPVIVMYLGWKGGGEETQSVQQITHRGQQHLLGYYPEAKHSGARDADGRHRQNRTNAKDVTISGAV